ncbi:MAG: hypothetical protein ABSB41_06160 [Anaerolineales bacterium]|jgi:hypothetical protein
MSTPKTTNMAVSNNQNEIMGGVPSLQNNGSYLPCGKDIMPVLKAREGQVMALL